MNRFIKYIAFPVCMILLSSVTKAQTMSLQQYRQNVIDYSQQLKQANEQFISSKEKTAASKTGFLPKISATANGTIDLTNLNHWNGPDGAYHPYTYWAGGVLNQSIWQGGSVNDQYKANKIDTHISQENVLLTLNEICLQAEQAYWLASANNEYLAISHEYYKLINSQYEIINYRFMEGSIAKNDLLMITTRLKEAELSVKKAEVNHLTSYQNLNILMGINPNAKIENIENIMTIVNMPQYLPYERALVTRPEYQIANLQINLMQENRKLAISKFNPQITMQIQGGWGTASPNLGYKPTATVIPALTFSMQVWDWGERCKTNRQYKAMVNSYKYNRQIVIDNINKEVANSYTTMDQSYTQINIAKDNLKLAQEALTLNTYSYNEGKINIADLLSSQVSWIQAYSNYIAANYQFKIAIANYLNSLGMIVDGIEK